jgi:hypothetical protein
MNKLVIRNVYNNEILDQRFFMIQPTESQIQTYWIESVYKFGALIMLQNEKVRYIEIGVA